MEYSKTSSFGESTGFVSLLASQSIDFDSSDLPPFSSQNIDESSSKESRKWSPKEDVILIGAWLNTSKDPIVSNYQKAGAFWRRITEYYNSSPLLVGTQPRESGQCKQRWLSIDDQVCKFVGCYDSALGFQRSCQNDIDVMKVALVLFHNDHGAKFTLEHAWRELRHEQKWCSVEEVTGGRPPGVKAAKATKRKKSGKEAELTQLQGLLDRTEKKLLDSLLAKKEPLSELELALKLKLMAEML